MPGLAAVMFLWPISRCATDSCMAPPVRAGWHWQGWLAARPSFGKLGLLPMRRWHTRDHAVRTRQE